MQRKCDWSRIKGSSQALRPTTTRGAIHRERTRRLIGLPLLSSQSGWDSIATPLDSHHDDGLVKEDGMRDWLKRITSKQAVFEPNALPAAAGAAADPAAKPIQPIAEHFVSDEPIIGAAQDRFNRAPFAARIADTIARRPDLTSLVVGVFGPWGDGKTSVLKMMEEELQRHDNVVVLRFNPWHFQSEEQLIRGFFATLAEGLDQKLDTAQERIGKVLRDYGSLLSLGSFAVAGGAIQLLPGDAAKGLGEALSNVSLDKQRSRIETILAASGKRVVVLVDDIDRLDRAETHSMFKLVKLSAGFNHTAYVLAFDDEVVAAALGERYGAGGQQAGRAFLEKIIQVPLHLPPVDELALREVAFEGVQAALDMAGIQLTQPDADAFMRHFVDGLERKLTTPRVAKLYTNALMFALPLLKGEVNTMNLMLIEGIRLLYPSLYAAIRDNPSLFLVRQERALRGLELVPNRLDEVVDAALTGFTPGDRDVIKTRLLQPLFPRTGNAIYGHEWESEWAREQKICSEAYFKRYFTYCVPDRDIADASIAELLDRLTSDDDTKKRERLAQFASRRSMPRLISTLRRRIDGLDADRAAALARAIALSGDLIVRERGQIMLTAFIEAGILVSTAIQQLPDLERRWIAVEEILQSAIPLDFAAECARWMYFNAARGEADNIVQEADNARIDNLLAQRIAAADQEQPIYRQFPKGAANLYFLWNRAAPGAPGESLQRRLAEAPADLDAFIDCFIGEGWEMESGLPVRSDLRRETYNSIVQLINEHDIMANLRARYGEELNVPINYPPRDWPHARKFAHQFAAIYTFVTQATVEASETALPSEQDPQPS